MIDHVYVTNTLNDDTPLASRRVVQTILESDMIVLGPGSLFTSILPNIVIKEIGQALFGNQGRNRLCLQYHDPTWGDGTLYR